MLGRRVEFSKGVTGDIMKEKVDWKLI